jgi:hypothetical protein
MVDYQTESILNSFFCGNDVTVNGKFCGILHYKQYTDSSNNKKVLQCCNKKHLTLQASVAHKI